MPPGHKAVSAPTNHPVLGPSVEIFDDRNSALGSLLLGLACVCLGPVGLFYGLPDLSRGDTVLGLAYAIGGPLLLLYGALLTYRAVGRLRHPVALVVGRNGFERAGAVGDLITQVGQIGLLGEPGRLHRDRSGDQRTVHQE